MGSISVRYELTDDIAGCVNHDEAKKNQKVISTRASQAVPHLSTNRALSRLTSEFEWDPVLLA